MASTYSQYKLELIGTGEQAGTWGTTTNSNFGSATPGTYQGFEQAIGGRADVTMSSTTITLSLTNSNAAQDARALYLNLSGTPGGAADLVVPALQKSYLVKNGTTGGYAVTIKVTGQTGVSIPNGKTVWVYNNGTDVVTAVDHIPSLTLGAALPIASGGTGSTSTTFVDLTTNVTGTLPVANGGTGITSFGTGVATFLGTPSSANLAAAVTDETGSGALVFATSPTLVTPALGTPASGTLTNATGLPISTGVSGLGTGVATFLGTPSSANLAAAVTDETGSGALVFATSPTFVTPVLGTPTSGQLSACTVDGTDAVGFRNTPVNSQDEAYETVLADSGKTILHPVADDNARIFTIPANSSVAYPVGTVISFVNLQNTVTIAITTDTMYLANDGDTGDRTLAEYGMASAMKVASTTWIISGNGLT
jgi:hypothetical protein